MHVPCRPICFSIIALAISACDHKATDPGASKTTASVGTVAASPSAVATTTSKSAVTATSSAPPDGSITVGHIRVAIKKATIGKVPLKAADGTITYSDEPRLMIALRIENVSDKKQSGYNTWVPDLDAAKTVAKLTDDKGTELKRVTFGFGNNVKDRTVLDTLTPGKMIGDLLVFEAPATMPNTFRLELPGANCGVKGSFVFAIDPATLIRLK